jgi:hypothetical protein
VHGRVVLRRLLLVLMQRKLVRNGRRGTKMIDFYRTTFGSGAKKV